MTIISPPSSPPSLALFWVTVSDLDQKYIVQSASWCLCLLVSPPGPLQASKDNSETQIGACHALQTCVFTNIPRKKKLKLLSLAFGALQGFL